MSKLFQVLHRELTRMVLMILVGFALIHFTPELAVAFAIPALSPWGLFVGGMLLAAAVSHLMRRLLFPKLDLQLIAFRAVGGRQPDGKYMDHPSMPAAVVFATICAILGLLLYLNASLLRL